MHSCIFSICFQHCASLQGLASFDLKEQQIKRLQEKIVHREFRFLAFLGIRHFVGAVEGKNEVIAELMEENVMQRKRIFLVRTCGDNLSRYHVETKSQ
jgi:hypothetical protein